MSGHTPGRLTVRGGYSIYGHDGKTPVADTCLTNSIPANDEANARRLVACWNTCEGLTTESLENIDMLGETLAGRFAAFHERERELMDIGDELLAALDEANASRIAAQTENEALKSERAASGVADRRAVREATAHLTAQRDELLNALRPLITKRMGAEQIREGLQRAIARAAIAKVEP